MKKYLLLTLSLLLCTWGVASAAYQQQWFSQYTEKDGKIDFRCEKNCVVLLGEKGGNDFVKVQWGTVQWNGQRGYGYLLGQQIYAATMLQPGNYEWSFVDDPIFKQIPDGDAAKVMFLVTGPLKVEWVQITMASRGGSDAIGWIWKRFRKTEMLAPYSINLHYWPYVGGWSWPLFGLIATLIAVGIVYIVRKKMNLKETLRITMIALIAVMIVGGVRLLVDDMKIIAQGHKQYTAVKEWKTFFDLGSYIDVTKQVRDTLDLDNVEARRGKECKIYAKSNMSRPFDAHRNSVYLRPCTVVQTGSEADYGLYYNVWPSYETGINILSGFNFYLYNFRQ